MHYITNHLYYDVLDPLWNEAERLVSWFGLPVLLYIAGPLLVLSLVLSRERVFKAVFALTVLVAVPTALYWDDIAAMRIYFYRHYSSAPPPAPAKRHRVRFAEPDSYIVRWLPTSKSGLAVPYDAFVRSKESTRKRRRNDAVCTGPIYSGIEPGVRNPSLVNVEKISKGLKTSLPDILRRL